MTTLEIVTAAASYLDRPVVDLTTNGLNLGLVALNQARRAAEMNNDFEFQRKLVTISVDGVTGGSLETAVLYGTAAAAEVKTVVEVGLFDDQGNLRPVEWTTVAEGLERQRQSNWPVRLRYPTDAQLRDGMRGLFRLEFSGSNVYPWPKDSTTAATTLGIEAYVFEPDWTSLTDSVAVTGGTGVTGVNDTYYRNGTYNTKALFLNVQAGTVPAVVYAIWWNGTAWIITTASSLGTVGSNYHSLTATAEAPDGSYTGHGTFTGTAVVATNSTGINQTPWTTKGEQYLLWQTVCQLNKLFKHFVGRQEGNLGEPQALADQGLQALIEWDVSRFEQHRRHNR